MSKLENSIYKNITKEANIIYKKTKNNLNRGSFLILGKIGGGGKNIEKGTEKTG